MFHTATNYTMLFWILGTILVLSTDVLSQDDLNCGSSEQVFRAIESCNENHPSIDEYFISDDTFYGYKIISKMASVCGNYPNLQTCVASVGARCPQVKTTLYNAAERYHNRLCTGNGLSTWFTDAIDRGAELNKQCLTESISAAFSKCPTPPSYDLARNVSVPIWYAWTQSFMTARFRCLRENLQETMTCGVNAQDAMVVFYTFITASYQLELIGPSDEEFEMMKRFLRPASRRDWIPILAGRR